MKWITHKVVAVGAAFVLGMPPVALAGVCLGAILPDLVEQRVAGLSFNRQKTFNRIHRGTVHWFGWWALLALAEMLPVRFLHTHPQLTYALAGVGFGGLMHVALDMCTVHGVPLVPWSKKKNLSLKLCKTGGMGEYVFLAAAVLALVFFARHDLHWLAQQVRHRLT